MTKFLILFAIVALASVNAQYNRANNGFPGNFFPGFPGFPGFPALPLPPLFPPLSPENFANINPVEGVASGSVMSMTSAGGKTETIFGTSTNGKGKFYHIKS